MKIQKLDRKKAEEQPLQQMIREYILHDRGNSIFLGDSFANLPSPVGEGQTIKNFFRFNEDEDNEKKLERENKERNEIKIEGKSEKKSKADTDKDREAKVKQSAKNFKIDIDEIDRIVFEQTKKKKPVQPHPGGKKPVDASAQRGSGNQTKHQRGQNLQQLDSAPRRSQDRSTNFMASEDEDPYQDLKETKHNKQMNLLIDQSVDMSIDRSYQMYQEEDSYINPSNVSKVNQSGLEDAQMLGDYDENGQVPQYLARDPNISGVNGLNGFQIDLSFDNNNQSSYGPNQATHKEAWRGASAAKDALV